MPLELCDAVALSYLLLFLPAPFIGRKPTLTQAFLTLSDAHLKAAIEGQAKTLS